MMKNNSDELRFNRVKKANQYFYLNEFHSDGYLANVKYSGYIKCKLVHNKFYSIVIPDQIYVDLGGQLHWIQPLYYSGCLLAKYELHGTCQLNVDISHGVKLNIQFRNDMLLSKYKDGSLFYKCEINAPKYLYRYTTGLYKLIDDKPV